MTALLRRIKPVAHTQVRQTLLCTSISFCYPSICYVNVSTTNCLYISFKQCNKDRYRMIVFRSLNSKQCVNIFDRNKIYRKNLIFFYLSMVLFILVSALNMHLFKTKEVGRFLGVRKIYIFFIKIGKYFHYQNYVKSRVDLASDTSNKAIRILKTNFGRTC